tara:strand:+ start:157 stop:1026 length:870 start_codon:yes stop_codon:yes gene_type:complete
MINENDITFIYTVGGHDVHYDNMARSIQSVKDQSSGGYNFLVLEFGNKLKSSDNVEVINLPDAIDFDSGKKVGYLIWKHKYIGALKVKTKYGVYVDSDTVMAYNNIVGLCKAIEDGFGVCRHFWVPDIENYRAKACTQETIQQFLEVKETLGLQDYDPFFAGGVFLFRNNEKNQEVMRKVLEYYDDYYSSKEYVRSITDELFLAAALKQCQADVKVISGALNHCTMGDQFMPMAIDEESGALFGRNSFESQWAPITFLHCDISRRDPSEEYTGGRKRLVKKHFGMVEVD